MTTRQNDQVIEPHPQELDLRRLSRQVDMDDKLSQELALDTGVDQEVSTFERMLSLGGTEQLDERTIQIESPRWRAMPEFIPLESWQGRVLEVSDETFTARLSSATDLTAEDAEFEIEEISRSDVELLEPGAVFYWNVGYRVDRGGRRARQSLISFRRLPAYSRAVLDEIAQEATAIADDLGWLEEDES